MTIEYKDSKRIITSPSSATSVQGYSQLNAGTNGWNIASGALDGERLSLQIVSGSSIIADPIKEIKMKLSKNSSPTDTFYVRVRNSSDTILAEASMDSSTISASLTEYTFTLNTGVILAQGDRINAEYTGSSGSGNVSCGVNNATEPSTVNCQKYDGSSYSDIDRTPDWQFDSSPSTTISILQDKPTDVQDNSILVEKDTAKRYWFESELAPTYEDDFTSDNSVDQDASKISVNTAQERWDFNIVNDQTNDSSSIDITTALSDTNWVMDFDYTWTSLSGTTNVNTSFFGISNSNGTVPSQTAQDHIGVRLQTGSGFSIAGCHSNNGTMQSGLSATFTTIPSVTTLYFRIVRTSTTSMTVKIYTTSARTTVSEEKTVAVSASTTGLRYVKISPYEGTNGGSNTEVGYVKNLKIYNAVTSVTPATWTMNPTYETTFSGSDSHTSDNTTVQGWLSSDASDIGVNGTGHYIDWDQSRGTNDSISYDLGTDVSSTKWVLRYKIRWDAFVSNAYNEQRIGLSNLDSTNAHNATHDFIGAFHIYWTSVNRTFYGISVDGGTIPATAPSSVYDSNGTEVVNTWYYVSLQRLSATTFSVTYSSTDAYDGDLFQSSVYTCDETNVGQRYIYMTCENAGSGDAGMNSHISDIKFYNGVTTPN
jgi:hypothetical protein